LNLLPTTRSCLIPAGIILAAGAARPAFAQTVTFQELYTFDGDSAGDRLGHFVSGAGDVNGDGFDDVIIGADYDDNNGDASGSARVFAGGPRLCADQNRDWQVTAADFSAWIDNFNAQSLIADMNWDGLVTPADFTAWIAAFNQGVNGPTCVP